MVSALRPLGLYSFEQPYDHTQWLAALSAYFSEEALTELACFYEIAAEAYQGVSLRRTQEPALSHAMSAALIIAGLHVGVEAVAATLLLGLPQFCSDYPNGFKTRLSPRILQLIDSAHRLGQIAIQIRESAETQADDTRKMMLAVVEDMLAVFIRLAWRTQTLRWLPNCAEPIRRRIAQETLSLFAPLANRLGVWQLKWELEDLSFRHLEPALYKKIAKLLDERRVDRERFIDEVLETLSHALEEAGIEAEVAGRPKHIYSIWRKMQKKKLEFSGLYDIRAVRVLVESELDCYQVLGIVHHLWQPIMGEFDDYIAQPKGNFYRSLHTAVLGPNEKGMEVQIRTFAMHEHAEYGVAAHWRYKEGGRQDPLYEQKIAELRQLLDSGAPLPSIIQGNPFDAATIYVLTPGGRIISLPAGATPVDFAYSVHTDLGHRCRGARVDGQMIALNTPLQTGQQVEIISTKEGGPSLNWLHEGVVTTHRAKTKIRHWIRQQQAVLNSTPLPPFEENPPPIVASASKVERDKLPTSISASKTAYRPGVFIQGVDRLMTSLSKCCKPLPPDVVKGFVTRGRGISIHREACLTFARLAKHTPERVVEAEWGIQPANQTLPADLTLLALDRPDLVQHLSEALARDKIHVLAMWMKIVQNRSHVHLTIEVKDGEQLQAIQSQLARIAGVIEVFRDLPISRP